MILLLRMWLDLIERVRERRSRHLKLGGEDWKRRRNAARREAKHRG